MSGYVYDDDPMRDPLLWMLQVAEARNTNKRARTVTLKFTRATLEMWQEQARNRRTMPMSATAAIASLRDGPRVSDLPYEQRLEIAKRTCPEAFSVPVEPRKALDTPNGSP